MKNTGVFATKAEIKKAFELAKIASQTPAFGLTSQQVLSGHDFASMAWRSAQEYCHALALQKGLPEIEGFYGMKSDGEFVTV